MISKSATIFFFLYGAAVLGQDLGIGRSLAMGNSGTALGGMETSMFNASAWSSISGFGIGAYHQRHFMNDDISTNGLLLGLPIGNSALGLQLANYGVDGLYSETRVGMAYARQFGPNLSMGTQLNFHQLQISRYVNTKVYSLDLGVRYLVNERWSLGLAGGNLANAAYEAEWAAELPMRLRLGAAYAMSPELLLVADQVYSPNESRHDFRLGLEYSISNLVLIRGGTALNPFMHFMGLGLHGNQFQLDFSSAIHRRLGVSPQIVLGYGF
ncbi:hypothetical protein [Olivibacter sitiensis]|uniref:hypothetical protein n=1 Tax=Olivibacter sitiensis TaxID=376470 RepID=UPI000484CFED|nr:hypothetical protein [Olivibacter sitiensis]